MKTLGPPIMSMVMGLALLPSAPVENLSSAAPRAAESRVAEPVAVNKRIVVHGAECDSPGKGLCPDVRALLDEAIRSVDARRHTTLRFESERGLTALHVAAIREYLSAAGVTPERACTAPLEASFSPPTERPRIVLSVSFDAGSSSGDLVCTSGR
jgi:hypothetical protein